MVVLQKTKNVNLGWGDEHAYGGVEYAQNAAIKWVEEHKGKSKARILFQNVVIEEYFWESHILGGSCVESTRNYNVPEFFLARGQTPPPEVD
jgi:hypothetical protein